MSSLSRFCSLIVFIVTLVIGAAGSQSSGIDSLRYDLEPGQVFSYSTKSEFTGEKGTGGTVGYFWVCVVDENEDGSWRLAIYYIYSFTENGSMIDNTAAGSYGMLVDIFPDGHRADQRTVLDNIDPLAYLPVFPASEEQRNSGWTFHEQADNTKHEFTEVSPDAEAASSAAIQDRVSSDVDLIFPTERSTRFEIGEYGMPISVEESIVRRRSLPGEGYRIATQRKVGKLEESLLVRLRSGIEAYLHGKNAIDAAFRAQTQSERASALAEVNEARDKVKEIKNEAWDKINELKLDGSAHGVSDVLQEFVHALGTEELFDDEANSELSTFIGKPGPVWEATAYDGKSWSNKDLLGKVTILDFWYRDCIWCIRAMPEVRRLAEKYAGEDVQILGMNVDREESDALTIIKEMGLTYPNIRATHDLGGIDIPWLFGVEAYPAIIVLDKSGVVRDFHEGYVPELFDDITKLVDRLVAEE